jgi:predicted nucleotidyltransferase
MSDVGMRPLRQLVESRREEIKAIVARHHGRSVSIFGSVARGDEQAGSDIDFLVELAPGTRPFELLAIGVELEEALGVKVDVGTPDSLREHLQGEALAEAVRL